MTRAGADEIAVFIITPVPGSELFGNLRVTIIFAVKFLSGLEKRLCISELRKAQIICHLSL